VPECLQTANLTKEHSNVFGISNPTLLHSNLLAMEETSTDCTKRSSTKYFTELYVCVCHINRL